MRACVWRTSLVDELSNSCGVSCSVRAFVSDIIKRRPQIMHPPPHLSKGPTVRRPSSLIAAAMLARTTMCYLLCAVRFFQQSMRNALPNIMDSMAKETPISATTLGQFLSAIPLGYFLTQVPGGALADRVGAKNVITWALLFSALCCLALPTMFDTFGASGFYWTLALMGAVQGPLFPTSSVFLAKWCPKAKPGEPDEKAWATSMLDVGISLGTLAIIPAVTFLVELVGWRHAYHMIGLASIGFVGVWQLLAASSPSECSWISVEERVYLKENAAQAKAKAKGLAGATVSDDDSTFARVIGMPRYVAMHPGVWAVFVAHMAFNFGAYYLTNWSKTYYKDVLGVESAEAAFHLSCPHMTNLAAKMLNPIISDSLASRGVPLRSSRRIFTCSGFVLAAAALLPVYTLKGSVWASTVLFSFANAFFGLAPCGFKANYLDITEEYVGVISGYGNTLGTVASFGQPRLLAFILDSTGATKESTAHGAWWLVLATVAGINLSAAANYALNATVSPVEHDQRKTRHD